MEQPGFHVDWPTVETLGRLSQALFQNFEGLVSSVAFLFLALAMLGFVYRSKTIVRFFGELKQAEDRLQQMQAHLPDVYVRLGRLTDEVDDISKAIGRVRAEVELNPTRNDDVLDELARVSAQLDVIAEEARDAREKEAQAPLVFTQEGRIEPNPAYPGARSAPAAAPVNHWEEVGAIWREMKADVEDRIADLRSELREPYTTLSRRNDDAIVARLLDDEKIGPSRAQVWSGVDRLARRIRGQLNGAVSEADLAEIRGLAQQLRENAGSAARPNSFRQLAVDPRAR